MIHQQSDEATMEEPNTKSRLEAFCDGVFAIAMTLLIIEIKVPSHEQINSAGGLWPALNHLFPSIFAFLLSFTIVFITWVNHHAALKLVDKLSSAFIYANGFMLLTIVFIPFPTALVGEYLLTDHAAPAVVLYSSICGLQAIGWILMGRTALAGNRLTKNESASAALRQAYQKGYYALALYAVCTAVAFWFPVTIAVVISCIWCVWLVVGIHLTTE